MSEIERITDSGGNIRMSRFTEREIAFFKAIGGDTAEELDERTWCMHVGNFLLPKDELAFVAWQFWEWVMGDGCPAETCKDFPCKYRQKQKADCEENLQNGDLDEEGYKLQQENGYYADKWCDEEQMGCWAQYYLWCYRNGYEPLNGKEVKR